MTAQTIQPADESCQATAKRCSPFVGLVAGGLVVLLMFLLVLQITRFLGGRFIYPLDDSYIQLAMARSLALHGNWGVTPGEFQAASSSPLYSLLLASTMVLFGDQQFLSLCWNAVALVLLCLLISHILKGAIGDVTRFAVTAAICLLAPAVVVAITGMEHILHTSVYLLLAWRFCGHMAESPGRVSRRSLMILALLAALCVGLRFESLLGAGIMAGLAILRRRWSLAAVVLFSELGVLCVYALFSVSCGGEWLPNPVLLKGHSPAGYGLEELFAFFRSRLYKFSHFKAEVIHIHALLLLGVFCALIPVRQPDLLAKRARYMLMLFVGATLLQILFARTGWLYRYELFLVVLASTSAVLRLALLVRDYRAGGRFGQLQVSGVTLLAAMAFLVTAALALSVRAVPAHASVAEASRDIYRQQIQMAEFCRTYYSGQTVAVNDVGAVSYLGNVKIMDLVGLADNEVARLRLSHHSDVHHLELLAQARNIALVIAYRDWISRLWGSPASSWREVAEWTKPDNIICGGPTVTFYAPNPDKAAALIQQLAEFKTRLPKEIKVTFFDLNSKTR